MNQKTIKYHPLDRPGLGFPHGGYNPFCVCWRCGWGWTWAGSRPDYSGLSDDPVFFDRLPGIGPGLEVGKTGRLDDHRRYGGLLPF